MSRPAQGTYIIYNRVLSASGEILAITFNGVNNTLTVTPKTGAESQVFRLTNHAGTTMTFNTLTSPTLTVAWGANGPTPTTLSGAVWSVRSSDTGYIIQDGGATVNWHIGDAVVDANVSIGGDQGNERYRWVFESVTLA